MPFSNNNMLGGYFGHPSFEADVNDQPIAGPSRYQDWYLHPSPEGFSNKSGYQGSTLLDIGGCQFADPYALGTDSIHGNFATGANVNGPDAKQRTIDTPVDYAGPSVANQATTPFTPFSPPTIPHQYARFSLTTAGIPPHGVYEQPLAGPSSSSWWSHTHPSSSVDEGSAQAADCIPLPRRPRPTESDARQDHRQHIVGAYGAPAPQTVFSVPPNTDFPSPTAPSYGPQRSQGAKGKGKAMQKGKGRRSRGSAEPLPEGADSSWEQTKDRFVWELLEGYYFRPAGRSINPEMAFANMIKFIKEDLHRSPLAAHAEKAKEGKKETHVYEQYLTRILRELLRSEDGDIPNTVSAYTEALEGISRELMPINERRVLKNGHTQTKDLNGVNNAPEKVKLREAERARRVAIRSLQEEISFYFFVRGPKKISGADLLLFIVIYLRIGPIAFPGLIHPYALGDGQQN